MILPIYRAVLIIFLFSFSAISENSIEQLRFYRDIELPAEKSPSSIEVIASGFDTGIYEKTLDGWPDVRITTVNGDEIPFSIRLRQTEGQKTDRKQCRTKIISFSKNPDNSASIIVEKTDESPDQSVIRIETRDRNFEKRVSVEGANDTESWHSILDSEIIFDYSDWIQLSNNEIKFAPSPFKYFKITLAGFAETSPAPETEVKREFSDGEEAKLTEKRKYVDRTIKVDSVTLYSESQVRCQKENIREKYPVEILAIKTEDKKTIIEIKSKREPLNAFMVMTDSTNFNRDVSVYGGGDPEKLHCLSKGKITKIDIGAYLEQNLKVSFPESRFNFYRIEIENGDAPTLKIKTIQAEGNSYYAAFFPFENSSKYRIYYDGDTQKPVYDIENVLNDVKVNTCFFVKNGKETANPLFRAGSGKRDYGKLFYPLIALMVGVLSFFLYTSIRKIDLRDDNTQ